MPVSLDLPGPSRRVRVEPLRLPDPARVPEPDPVVPDGAPEEAPPPAPDREREPAHA
jgi:hypothetical protein